MLVRTQNDNCSGTVTDFFVLGAGELQHTLSSRVCNFDLTQDRISVIRQDDRALQYFVRRLRLIAYEIIIRHEMRGTADVRVISEVECFVHDPP